MASANGLRVVGYFDCPGGGQVVVHNRTAYVGHIKPPDGTSIIDVSDPAKPSNSPISRCRKGTLSHKVRVENGVMLVNREIFPIGRKDPDFRGGLEVFDVSTPSNPKRTSRPGPTRGMHRFTFDGRYVYGSPELDGYLGNVVSIIDFKDPAQPEEVGRWWMPGQWTAGGEKPTWEGTGAPLPSSDARRQPALCQLLARRLRHSRHRRYEQAEIRFRSRLEPAISLADPYRAAGAVSAARAGKVMLVADEDVVRLEMAQPSFLWLVDITDETRPIPFASFQVDGRGRHAEAGLHRAASVLRGNPQHGDSHRLVRTRSADRRHRQSACAANRSHHSCRTCRRVQAGCRATTSASTIAA